MYTGLRGGFVKKHRLLGHEVCWGDPVRNVWWPETIWEWTWGVKANCPDLQKRDCSSIERERSNWKGWLRSRLRKFLLLWYSQLCLLSRYYCFTSCRELSLRLTSVTYIGEHHCFTCQTVTFEIQVVTSLMQPAFLIWTLQVGRSLEEKFILGLSYQGISKNGWHLFCRRSLLNLSSQKQAQTERSEMPL